MEVTYLHAWISLLEIARDIMPNPNGVRTLLLLKSGHKNPPTIEEWA
jgi:hypothetical protein